MKTGDQDFIELAEGGDVNEFMEKLKQLEHEPNSVLVIEGEVLSKLLDDERSQADFIKYSSLATSVVCCRCAPTQKAELVRAIKKNLNKVIACIGDGGNDVAMIQKADVGIGLEGKEGTQAALSSDFSITEFKAILPLFLWMGRLSYLRTGLLSNFIFHRGLIVSIIQFLYTVMYGFSPVPLYNGYLLLGYATIFTCLPVFCLVFDEDVTYQQVIHHPKLYKIMQQGRELSILNFLAWASMSIYEAVTMFLVLYFLFNPTFLDLVTISFTALILIEMLNIVLAVHKLHPMIVAGIFVSLGTYALCLFAFRDWFMLGKIDGEFFLIILLIVSPAWLPVFIAWTITVCLKPTELQRARARAMLGVRNPERVGPFHQKLLDESQNYKT